MSAIIGAGAGGGVAAELGGRRGAWWRDPWAAAAVIGVAVAAAVLPWAPDAGAVIAVFATAVGAAGVRERWVRVVITPTAVSRRGPFGTRHLPASEVRRIAVVDDEVHVHELVVTGPGLRSVAVPLSPSPTPAEVEVLRAFVAAAGAAGADVDAAAVTALSRAIARA